MKLLTGLFRFARKRTLTADTDMGAFRDKINELVEGKDSLSEEEVVEKVEELKGLTADLPDEEEKAKLDRFLEDFKSVKEQDEATAKEAASLVADLFEKLDTQAMQDVPEVEEKTVEETEEVPLVEGSAPEAEAKETVEETVAPEGEDEGEAEDADPNPAYTLEEIYQFCKKRQAEDAAAEDSAEEVEEEDEEEEEKVVSDHAPHIPVTLSGKASAAGTIGAMFAQIKTGGR